MRGHRIAWFAFVGGEMLPREPWMTKRAGVVGYDAECSCGWASNTGGAIEARVREAVTAHLDDADPERFAQRLERRRARFEAWRNGREARLAREVQA